MKSFHWLVLSGTLFLPGCVAVTVVDTAVSATATAVGTAVDVTAGAVEAAGDLVIGDDED
ncbi:MAG: hypothetical protein AAF666_07515 [Pseudomonadota bacterium]